VIIEVVDGAIIGSQKDLDEIIRGLSTEFVIITLRPMKDFVGCRVIKNYKNDIIWVHQPKLLKNLKLECLTFLDNHYAPIGR
jgi:hypothetical protein